MRRSTRKLSIIITETLIGYYSTRNPIAGGISAVKAKNVAAISRNYYERLNHVRLLSDQKGLKPFLSDEVGSPAARRGVDSGRR